MQNRGSSHFHSIVKFLLAKVNRRIHWIISLHRHSVTRSEKFRVVGLLATEIHQLLLVRRSTKELHLTFHQPFARRRRKNGKRLLKRTL